ncbi:hypothetical protein ACERII_19440 [Evansella sp. AB-rgal1]|uniref:hypothetical protein n=1 Tax=Evansella sp. AB-rgal1 TaxID=3242696 RepID=UPI00359DA66B
MPQNQFSQSYPFIEQKQEQLHGLSFSIYSSANHQILFHPRSKYPLEWVSLLKLNDHNLFIASL